MQAISATVARYASARTADRQYVRIKLRTDPLTWELLQSDEPLGDTLDVGCGRGQFGLLLIDLGRASTIAGFDWDAAKVSTANAAAGSIRYQTADLRSPPPIARVDTILLFDVLQYLTTDEQRQLLERVVAGLRPGGRLLVRTADRARGWRAGLSQTLEWVGRALGINRSHVLHFRSSSELKTELEALGLVVRRAHGGSSDLLDNRLWIAELPSDRC